MKNIVLKSMLAISLLGVSGPTLTSVYAGDGKDVSVEQLEEKGGFRVIPVFDSKYQSESNSNYYDLKWQAGKVAKVGIAIKNESSKEKTFAININKAITNSNGATEYADSSQNESNEVNVVDFISFPKEVTVPAKSKKTVKGTVTFGDKPVEGVLMGGVLVGEVDEAHEGRGEVAVKVNYAYPLVIRGEGATDGGPVDLVSGKFSIKKDESGFFALTTPFENKTKGYTRDASFDVSIKDKEGNEVYGSKTGGIFITPETKVNYQTLLTNSISPGNYKVSLTIETADETFTFSDTVEVTKEVSKSAANAEVRLGDKETTATSSSNTPLLIASFAFSALGVLILLAGMIIRKKEVR